MAKTQEPYDDWDENMSPSESIHTDPYTAWFEYDDSEIELLPSTPNMIKPILCTDIIMTIFSFLPFNSLLLLKKRFQIYYKHRLRERDQCPIYRIIVRCIKITRHLTFTLIEKCQPEPDMLYRNIEKTNILQNLISLNMNLVYHLKLDCNISGFTFDFSSATQLKHLTIVGAMLDNIQLHTHNLVTLKLSCLKNNYMRYDSGDDHLYNIEAFNRLLENTPKLEKLYLDHVPYQFNMNKPISKILQSISIGNNNGDLHGCYKLLQNNRETLRRLRLTLYGVDMIKLLERLKHKNINFPIISSISFDIDALSELKEHPHIKRLPICKKVFPNLQYLTIGIQNDMNELKLSQNFLEYEGVHHIILRPTLNNLNRIQTKITDDFKRSLIDLSTGTHKYIFLNFPVCTFGEERIIIEKARKEFSILN